MRATIRSISVIVLGVLAWSAAAGVRAENRGAWFKSLKQPGSQAPCCDISDCERTVADWRNGQWWAIVRGLWMPIPRDRELSTPSIDGSAYVCSSYAKDRMIFCFVPPNLAM
ncbi:MAG: hypothetical protein K8F58_09195 [Bauldia sp.]|nr:hypothetical protein [Bauldia sp.]